MKVHNPIGSKARFQQIFEGVAKVKLNEGFGEVGVESRDMVEPAFNALISGELNIEQVNNQVNGNESILEITGNGDGEQATFKFRVSSSPTDQDDVTSIDDAKLIQFNFQSPELQGEYPEQFNAIANLNANRKQDILNVVSEYIDTPSPEDTVSDEMFEEAIKLIDKVPYKKSTETIQTSKAYGDQKPTNPELRVDSPELQQYLSELQEYEGEIEDVPEEDPFAMPPEPSAADMVAAMPKTSDDDGSIGVDPYDQEPEFDDTEQSSPEEQALYSQAYDNLLAAGYDTPTNDQIEREVANLQGNIKPVEKTRAIPKGAEDFWEADSHVVGDVNADDVTRQGYENLLPDEKKQQLIFKAAEIVDMNLGVLKKSVPKDIYLDAVRKTAIELYRNKMGEMNEVEDTSKSKGDGKFWWKVKPQEKNSTEMNEDDDKKIGGDFPNPMGKKFKPKNQMPKKKKKPQSVVKLSEEDEETGNIVPGGKADEKDPVDFNAQQIMIGMGIEMEHTDDPKVALEITMDHLTEIPDYYTRLDKMEKEAKVGDEKPKGVEEMKDGEKDEELTDTLLGFKPHNVGDYANEELDLPASPEQEKKYWDKEYFKQDQEAEEPLLGGPQAADPPGMKFEASEGQNLAEEEGMEEYQGEIGDRYQDGEGNQFTVRDKVKGGVTLQGQGGEKEIATRDIGFLKKLSESKEVTEELVKTARLVLKNRISEGMTKKEAVQILINHNIK